MCRPVVIKGQLRLLAHHNSFPLPFVHDSLGGVARPARTIHNNNDDFPLTRPPITTAPPHSCSPPQIATPNSTILSNAMPCMRNLFESGRINGRRQILSFVMHQSTGKMGDTQIKNINYECNNNRTIKRDNQQ